MRTSRRVSLLQTRRLGSRSRPAPGRSGRSRSARRSRVTTATPCPRDDQRAGEHERQIVAARRGPLRRRRFRAACAPGPTRPSAAIRRPDRSLASTSTASAGTRSPSPRRPRGRRARPRGPAMRLRSPSRITRARGLARSRSASSTRSLRASCMTVIEHRDGGEDQQHQRFGEIAEHEIDRRRRRAAARTSVRAARRRRCAGTSGDRSWEGR